MEDKIKIIDQIIQFHPSLGVDKEWSEYTGGMKDSGQWFFRKMLNESIESLQSFLQSIMFTFNRYTVLEKINLGNTYRNSCLINVIS